MEKALALIVVTALFLFAGSAVSAEQGKGKTGEELFKEHCSQCHPDGGNIVNPAFTLKKADREAHGVKKAGDIIGKMRNPGPGMTMFDKTVISDKEAKEIAEYIMKTFR